MIVEAAILGALAALLAPVVLISGIRNAYINELAVRRSRFFKPAWLFIGDSIVEGGRPWGMRMGLDPFSAVTSARGGAMTRQIADMLPGAPCARVAVIMAGPNDAPETPPAQYVADFKRLLSLVNADTIVVTLIPPTRRHWQNLNADALNAAILPILADDNVAVIDLKPLFAEQDGLLKSRYTTDGVHFSDAAYRLWALEIRKMAD